MGVAVIRAETIDPFSALYHEIRTKCRHVKNLRLLRLAVGSGPRGPLVEMFHYQAGAFVSDESESDAMEPAGPPFRRLQGASISRDSTMGLATSITRSKSASEEMTAIARTWADSPG